MSPSSVVVTQTGSGNVLRGELPGLSEWQNDLFGFLTMRENRLGVMGLGWEGIRSALGSVGLRNQAVQWMLEGKGEFLCARDLNGSF